MKVFVVVALACPLLSAAGCSGDAGSCALEQEETSLLQVGRSVKVGIERLTVMPTFASFVSDYGRVYPEGEYEMRHAIYEQRLEQVQSHNSNPHRRWSAAVNHLTDRTEVELKQLRGLRAMRSSQSGRTAGMIGTYNQGNLLSQVEQAVIPDEKSWADLNSAQESTDQSSCGSCWAVASATVLRTNAEIKGYNRTFSPQELVSCSPNPHECGGTGGCGGSTIELAMDYVMEQGLDNLEGTPYEATDAKCKKGGADLLSYTEVAKDAAHLQLISSPGHHKAKSAASGGHAIGLIGWERLPENKYDPIMRAVAHTGPLGVSVAAGEWNSYSNGVFDSCGKDATIDHAVTLLGYGKAKVSGDKYWLIKNSWSNTWGEDGNIRMLRHEGDVHCGTDKQPDVGTGCKGGPASVHVCGMCGILYDTVAVHFHPSM